MRKGSWQEEDQTLPILGIGVGIAVVVAIVVWILSHLWEIFAATVAVAAGLMWLAWWLRGVVVRHEAAVGEQLAARKAAMAAERRPAVEATQSAPREVHYHFHGVAAELEEGAPEEPPLLGGISWEGG